MRPALPGHFSRETIYSEDPLAVARQWQEQGASRLHLVDLDGAAKGDLVHLDIIAAIVAQSGIRVQVGGGVRTSSTAEKLLSLGVERVVIGTAAVRNPDLVRQLCQDGGSPRVVVALDARDGLVAVQGWLEKTSVTAVELGKRMAELGVERLLYTDISRDGTLSEPNFSANTELVESTGLAILASGGISSLDHITELAKIGAGRGYSRAGTLHRRLGVTRGDRCRYGRQLKLPPA